jgi:Protein of unknown function (DUF3592)
MTKNGQKNVAFWVGSSILSRSLSVGGLDLAVFSTIASPIVGILILTGAILLGLRGLAWSRLKAFLAGGWLNAQGRVEFGSTEEHRLRYFSYYIARIDYSYSVNGEYYSGYFEKVFLRESSADGFVESKKGQSVFVRAHPDRPERSVLREEDQMGA